MDAASVTEEDVVDVLVVGAGPTGLTLACMLRRQGVVCRVVERSTAFHTRSRGKGLQPRTLELLDDLGVAEDVVAEGWSRDVRLRWHVGVELVADLVIRGRDPRPDTPFPNIVLLPQWRTERALREVLERLDGRVELGKEAVALEQDAAGVTVVLRDAATGTRAAVRARYVVGCDGAHSSVRRQLGVPMRGETRDEHFVVADVEIDGLDPGAAHVWFDAGRYLAASPFPGQRAWQVQASLEPRASGEVEATSLDLLRRLVRERTGRADVELHDAGWLSAFVPNVRMVDRYRHDRVLLAGDAAHVHSPVGGQGMNLGMQDAYNLGWKLGLVVRGKAGESLLDTYEEERLPVARSVLEGTDVGFDVVFSRNPVIAVLRERVLVPLLRFPAVQRAVLGAGDQLDVGYRGGRLAREGVADRRAPQPGGSPAAPVGAVARMRFARAPHAGDRAPDLVLSDSATGLRMRLFDALRGPQFTLLVFTDAPTSGRDERFDPLAGELERRLGRDVRVCTVARVPRPRTDGSSGRAVHDVTGRAHRRYGVTGEAMYLVRPDGYIAFRAQGASRRELLSSLDDLLAGAATTRDRHRPLSATRRPS